MKGFVDSVVDDKPLALNSQTNVGLSHKSGVTVSVIIDARIECTHGIQSWVIHWTFNCDVNEPPTPDVRAECLRFLAMGINCAREGS